MSLFSKEHIEKIKNYDFFNTEGPYFDDVKTTVAWGRKKDRVPKVSVLLTTYKRPEMLKISLGSILNQKEFNDYEVIVFDNECAPLNIVTETQRVIEAFDDEKVIYCRNQSPSYNRVNLAASWSNSEWICFVQDDDAIHPYHLKIMTDIIKKNPAIDYLACRCKPTNDSKFNGELFSDYQEIVSESFVCRRVHKEEVVFLDNYTWLGALIKRKKFKEIGGFSYIHLEMTDTIFSAKATHLINRYYIHIPLYYYRHSEAQASSSADAWMNCFTTNYFFSCYVMKKIYGKCTQEMKDMVLQRMLEEIEVVENERKLIIDRNDYIRRIGEHYNFADIKRKKLNKTRNTAWKEYLINLRNVGHSFIVTPSFPEGGGIKVCVGE